MRLIALFAVFLSASPAAACVSGMKCISVPEAQKSDQLELGDPLPRGEYQMVLNSRYMGLPRPETGTVYYRVEHRILRVDMMSLTILEDMTHTAGRVAR
jgi:hypothetical protein